MGFGNRGAINTVARHSNAAALNTHRELDVYKVHHIDASEILYEPNNNTRRLESRALHPDAILRLRESFDRSKMIQPVMIYPLTDEQKDPTKPAVKYGIAIGHRRYLACALNSGIDPRAPSHAIKVPCLVDYEWTKLSASDRLLRQLTENTERADQNVIELGYGMLRWQEEVSKEKGRLVSQREMLDIFGVKEKRMEGLFRAAQIKGTAALACDYELITDVEVLISFDHLCKESPEMGEAILEALKAGASVSRDTIRAARIVIKSGEYTFDKASFVWPDSILAIAPQKQPKAKATEPPVQAPTSNVTPAPAALSVSPAPTPAPAPAQQTATASVPVTAPAGSAAPSTPVASPVPVNNVPAAIEAAPTAQAAPVVEVAPKVAARDLPIILIKFKMGAEATKTFTGELLPLERAKSEGFAVVSYINDRGTEERVEVRCNLIELVSVNH